MLREPAVSGYFYPSEPSDLRILLKDLESKVSGIRSCPNPLGAIVPHAGLVYSGLTAMHGYLSLSASRKRKYIIIGPNHNSFPYYSALYPGGGWLSPLGKVDTDGSKAEDLMTAYRGMEVDADAHSREHSVEVQVPFLQYLYGPNLQIVPMVMGNQSEREAMEVAKSVFNNMDESLLISSSDLTHYEPESAAREKDAKLIEAVESLDVHRFYETIATGRITACGFGPIAVMMEVTRMSGGTLELLDYRTSGDAGGDRSSVVGYASFLSCLE